MIHYLVWTPGEGEILTSDPSNLSLVEHPADPQFNAGMYHQIGERWSWIDRAEWSQEQWTQWLQEPGVRTYRAYHMDTLTGYAEVRFVGAACEIVYFGILESHTGQGLGKLWLHRVLKRLVEEGATRIWLHTCDQDHPAALDNYLARGFRLLYSLAVSSSS